MHRTLLAAALAVVVSLPAVAAETTADTNLTVIVTASRVPAPELVSPFFTEVVSANEMAAAQRNTLPESLNEIPGILVQKTAHGQGSPYIRGFTGFRTLLLVDGVRLNNSVFREGANQYWSTVDSLMLDRLEVVEGPGSVLYGSDAVGGTVQAFSRDPLYADEGKTTAGGMATYRYASASDTHVGRLEGEAGSDQTAVLAGMSRRIFGEVDGGGDVGEQLHTDYDAWDWDVKVRQALGADRELVGAWQHTFLDDVWRTHATVYGISWHGTQVGSDLERSLDQQRDLAYLQYRDEVANALYDTMHTTVSWHRQSEDQYRVKKDVSGDAQGFDVDTWGAAAQMAKLTALGAWVYGIDLTRDWVDAYQRKVRSDGSYGKPSIQGPVADDSTYDTLAAYAEDTLALSDRFDLVAGGRATHINADAGRYQDPVSGDAASLERDWSDLSGDVRLVYWLVPERTWNVYAGAATAFRAPNLSDLTRFDTARSDEIETPSPEVDPEHFLTGEAGSKLAVGRLALEAAVFQTWIDDQIVRCPTGRTIDELREVTKLNASEGYVRGVTFAGRAPLTDMLSARLGFTWMEGAADSFDEDRTPVREPLRTMPMTLDAALRWTAPSHRLWTEVAGVFVDKEDRLSSADQSDTQRIPPGGTPGCGIVGVRSGWQPTAQLTLVAAVENVADQDYRVHGSGSNEPGRSLNVSATYAF